MHILKLLFFLNHTHSYDYNIFHDNSQYHASYKANSYKHNTIFYHESKHIVNVHP